MLMHDDGADVHVDALLTSWGRVVVAGSKWGKRDLTYRISVYPDDLSSYEVDDEIRRALQVSRLFKIVIPASGKNHSTPWSSPHPGRCYIVGFAQSTVWIIIIKVNLLRGLVVPRVHLWCSSCTVYLLACWVSYRRWFRSLLWSCGVFRALIASLLCWFSVDLKIIHLFQI